MTRGPPPHFGKMSAAILSIQPRELERVLLPNISNLAPSSLQVNATIEFRSLRAGCYQAPAIHTTGEVILYSGDQIAPEQG